MHNLRVQRFAALLVTLSLTGMSVLQPAAAAIISTRAAIELGQRQARIDHINQVLARDEVRDMLVGMGVDPDDASSRINSLTDEELMALDQDMKNLPAGGTGGLEVIGIVAIVLIVLELLHVTNFFNEF